MESLPCQMQVKVMFFCPTPPQNWARIIQEAISYHVLSFFSCFTLHLKKKKQKKRSIS